MNQLAVAEDERFARVVTEVCMNSGTLADARPESIVSHGPYKFTILFTFYASGDYDTEVIQIAGPDVADLITIFPHIQRQIHLLSVQLRPGKIKAFPHLSLASVG